MELLTQQTHLQKICQDRLPLLTSLKYFKLKTLETMLSFWRQFFKIGVFFHTLYLRTRLVTPIFSCITDTSNSLTNHSKSLKNISILQDFRANVLKKLIKILTCCYGEIFFSSNHFAEKHLHEL